MSSDLIIIDQDGAPAEVPPRQPTLADLIDAYTTDPVSSFHALLYHVRVNHGFLLRRLRNDHGHLELARLKARGIKELWQGWSGGGKKVAVGHALIGQVRTLCGYGADMLEDPECERLCGVLRRRRFPNSRPRTQRLTLQQVEAVRASARKFGWHSIALAGAFQFELMIRQKDAIGEWVPDDESGASEIHWNGWKWLRGIRWDEVDDNFVLRHTTSKKRKDIEVDLLHHAPMVVEELCIMVGCTSPLKLRREMFYAEWPIVLSEYSGLPWRAPEFRRKWRIAANDAGVPPKIFQMDHRASGITEAFEAGAIGDDIRSTATHSSITQTEDYNRGSYRTKAARTAQARIAARGLVQ